MVELQRSRSVGGLLQKGDPLRCVKKLSRELESEDQGRDLQSDTEDANWNHWSCQRSHWERCGCAASLADSPPTPPSSPQSPPPAPPPSPQTPPPVPPSSPQTEPPSATIIATDTPQHHHHHHRHHPQRHHPRHRQSPTAPPPLPQNQPRVTPPTPRCLARDTSASPSAHSPSHPQAHGSKADPEEEKQEKNRDSLRKLDPDGGWAGPAEPELESIKLDEPLGKERPMCAAKPSVFVEIDLGDHAEEVVTGTMKEEKQSEMDMGGSSEDEALSGLFQMVGFGTCGPATAYCPVGRFSTELRGPCKGKTGG
ncbi:uncharacterized protein C13orf46 homolog isoform X3 [Prionailurus iriomotensis]